MLFCTLHYTVNTAQHGKRQDNILVFAAFECITDEIGYAPDKIDFFAKVVHELLFSPFRHCIQQRFFSFPETAYYCACLLSSEKDRTEVLVHRLSSFPTYSYFVDSGFPPA